jgi:hypothetical protein
MTRPLALVLLSFSLLSGAAACGGSDSSGGVYGGSFAGAAGTSPSGGSGGSNSAGGSGNPVLGGGGVGSGGPVLGGGGSGNSGPGKAGSGSGGPGTAGSGNHTSGNPGGSCEGNFTLGKNFVVSGDISTYGQKCNSSAPTNCPDGYFINFPQTGECICVVGCSSAGTACNGDGSAMCEQVLATNADANSATLCVPTAWNLCTKGGSTGSAGSPGGSAGSPGSGSGGSPGGSCGPQGSACEQDEDCCSGDCFGNACD